MNKIANIIGWDNGAGLSRDIDILTAELKALGWSVAINGKRTRAVDGSSTAPAMERMRFRIAMVAVAAGLTRPPFELNFHLEDIKDQYIALARQNVLIPNHEWFREWCRPHLGRIDEVWAKTRVGERVFSDLARKVRYLGWTGMDRRVRNAGSKRLMAFHVAGASPSKGTETVLDVWSENPHWPLLQVLRRNRGYGGDERSWRSRPHSPNIRIITDRVDERTLMDIQNESAICVCPSEAEGFGHNILEAMSVGAVVITTDAPPMNELVTPDTGLLVAVDRSEPMSLGRRYFVNRADLARQIRAALAMTDEQRNALGRAARTRFEEKNAAFRASLGRYLDSVQGAASREAERSSAAQSAATDVSRE